MGGGVSVQGSLCPGGLCPGSLYPGGLCPERGSLSGERPSREGVCVQRGGFCPGGSLSREVSVQWGLCRGGVSVRETP